MVERHVSVLRAFSSGDVCEWLQGFEICSRANKWENADQALKLTTNLIRRRGTCGVDRTDRRRAVRLQHSQGEADQQA